MVDCTTPALREQRIARRAELPFWLLQKLLELHSQPALREPSARGPAAHAAAIDAAAAMASPDSQPGRPRLVARGVLHKKRGGMGRHRSSPYVRRYFELTSDGILSYWDEAEKRKGLAARNNLNLLSSRAVLAVVNTDPSGGAPSSKVLAIAHEQGGARWKLAADSDDARDAWRKALEPFCRASAPRPSADVRAVVPDLPPDLAQTRRKTLARISRAQGDAGATVVALCAFSLFVSVVSVFLCRGGAFAMSVLVLVHGYALVLLTRRGVLDPNPQTSVLKVAEETLTPLPAGIDTDKRDKGKRIAGCTIAESDFDSTGGGPPATWSRAPGSTFRVRQVGYSKHGKKAKSQEAFYEAVSVDMYDTASRIPCLADKLELPTPERLSPDPAIPSLFVVVAHIPSETGPMSVQPDADGHGYQMCIVFQLTERTVHDLQSLKEGGTCAREASLKLLKRWCTLAPEEPFAERKEFGRFKVLAQVRNIDDVSIPSFAKRYNGKPALIRKTGQLYRCGPSKSYLNMDINVHAFGYMARSGLQSIFRDFQDFILSVGFTIESRENEELPECILGCFDLNHVDYNSAVPWE